MLLYLQKFVFIFMLILLQFSITHINCQIIEIKRVDVACAAETICEYDQTTTFSFETPVTGTTKPWPSNIDSCGNFIPHWAAIIPNSDSIHLSIQNSNCGDDLLRIGLFRGIPDCTEWPYSFGMEGTLIGHCNYRYPAGVIDFELRVEAGVKYYLVFGDTLGGLCDVNFSIKNIGAEIEPEVNPTDVKKLTIPEFIGGDTICVGADSIRFTPDSVSQNAEYYLWKLPDTVIKRPFIRPYLDLRNDYFNDESEFELCIASANDCDTSEYSCRTISVKPPTVKEVSATQCLGYDFQFRDTIIETSTIQDPGVYEYEFFASSPTVGCDRFYKLTMTMKDGEKIEYNSAHSIDSTTIRFNNSIENQDSIKWYFGDDESSTAVNPVHTYDSFGVYDIVYDIFGICDFVTDTISVAIIPDLEAELEVGYPDSFCIPTLVNYMVDVNDEVEVRWIFEGAEQERYEGDSITVNYTEPGIHSFYISYIYSTDSRDFSQDTVFHDFIELYESPSAQFTDSLSGKTIYLNAKTPIDSSSTYVWDLGDGTNANGPSTVHTYQEEGTYVVELLETNPCGSEKMRDTIYIETTSIESFTTDNSISIYPNPFRDVVKISSQKNYNTLIVYNTNGKVVINNEFVKENDQLIINTSNLIRGVYFIRLMNENESEIVKCIKM